VRSAATTVEDYLAELPADRRAAIDAVRAVVNAHLPPGVEEGIQYGMIGWYYPHSVYPHGYHCDPKEPLPFLGLASQKANLALHLFCAYVSEGRAEWFRSEAARRGCRLDMGKACVRFRRAEDLPLDLVGEVVALSADFVEQYEARLPESVKKKRARAR
jgi:uncharacterized protein YdhG (YjbR/CyaY superfamily)